MDKIYDFLRLKIDEKNMIIGADMKRYTSFGIGGKASLVVLVDRIETIGYVLEACRKYNSPYFIMGQGSNIIVKDEGYRGIILKLGESFNAVRVEGDCIVAQAGVLLSTLSNEALKNGLSGLEFAGGIPGTLGGGVFMNAGAYGGEMSQVVEEVTVIGKEGQVIKLSRADLCFGYRSSKIQKEGYIIVEAKIKLYKGDVEEIKRVMKDYSERRKLKQPVNLKSAGSTFKRPEGFYAGKLIEDAGLKGLVYGGAQVSPLHAGFIVNYKNASASEVLTLIHIVQKVVWDLFQVEMKMEVRVIGG